MSVPVFKCSERLARLGNQTPSSLNSMRHSGSHLSKTAEQSPLRSQASAVQGLPTVSPGDLLNEAALLAAICKTEQTVAELEKRYRALLQAEDTSDLPVLTLALAKLSAQIDAYTVDLIALKKQEHTVLKAKLHRTNK